MSPGQIAFEAFWRTVAPNAPLDWEHVPEGVKAAWAAAEAAVRQDVEDERDPWETERDPWETYDSSGALESAKCECEGEE